MLASFNGARRNLVSAFNGLVSNGITQDQTEACEDLRWAVWGLLCMYDRDDLGDSDDLSGDIHVLEAHEWSIV